MDDERRAASERNGAGPAGDGTRVLVTGAAGFIGSHLCETLVSSGSSVWGIDKLDPYYSPDAKQRNLRAISNNPDMHVVEGDVRDDVLLDGLMSEVDFHAVVHLAALPGVRTSLEAPDLCMDINVNGTLSVLEAMGRHGVDHLVFASSSSVYGETTSPPFNESDAADRPISPYAASKRAGELLAHSYTETHGLAVHCLRIFTAFGPRQRPDLAIHKFAKLISEGEPIPLFGDGSSERDYTYVGDIVEGIRSSLVHLTTSAEVGEYEIINLGRGVTVRLDDLVRALSSALGAEPEIDWMPEQPGDMSITQASVDRARRLLGWEATVSLEEGLARFVDWFEAMEPVTAVHRQTTETARSRTDTDTEDDDFGEGPSSVTAERAG